ERFLDALLPSKAELLAEKGDEESLRAALELDPGHADAAIRLARIVHGRGQKEDALEILGHVHGSYAAEGLAARIRLERTEGLDLSTAFAALDAGDNERALDALIEAIPPARSTRDVVLNRAEQGESDASCRLHEVRSARGPSARRPAETDTHEQ